MNWLLAINRMNKTHFVLPTGRSTLALSPRLFALHLFILTSFAVTEPFYGLLSQHVGFVIDQELGLPAMLWFVLVMSVVIPSFVSFGQWGFSRLLPRSLSGVGVVTQFLLMTLIALPVMKRLTFPGWITIGMALSAAAGAASVYWRYRRVRSLVTCAAPGIVVFPAFLLFGSPASEIWFPSENTIVVDRKMSVPVVLVVFDEFCGMTLMNESRELDAVRFPNFAELARGATWFRNATTVHYSTAQAVPAILSGRLPTTGEFPPMVGDFPQNTFSVLQAGCGYELAAFEPISRLAPYETVRNAVTASAALRQVLSAVPTMLSAYAYFLFPTDFHEELEPLPPEWFGLKHQFYVDRQMRGGVLRYNWGDDRRGQFEHFLDCISGQTHPTLYFIHDLLPHVHWCYLPSGRKYIPDGSKRELLDFNTRNSMIGFWGADELFVIQSQQRYLLQAQFVDSLIGRLLARLHDTGLYDKCLLIVTADHGVSFKSGESRRAPTAGNSADIMSVPLFIKTPGQREGSICDRNVQTIDILPTIAEVLGFELPLPVDGRSVFDAVHPESTEKTIFNADYIATHAPASILAGCTVPEELRARFGKSDDPQALFRIGPHPELVDRPVGSLPSASESPIGIELLRYGSDYSSDGDAIVPCYLEGRVVVPSGTTIEEPVSIALAVNGSIQVVTRTYRLEGWREKWAAMVPETAFRNGENDIEFFIVIDSEPGAQSKTRLARCRHRVAGPAGTSSGAIHIP